MHSLYSIGAAVEDCLQLYQAVKPEEIRERGEEMNQRKEKALAAVLTCSNRTEAAKTAGITTRTLQEYFRDPEFQERYKKAFSDIVESAVREAQRAVSPAIQCLKDIVRNQNENATARVSAAKSILDYSLKAAEKLDIVERLDALEAALNEKH